MRSDAPIASRRLLHLAALRLEPIAIVFHRPKLDVITITSSIIIPYIMFAFIVMTKTYAGLKTSQHLSLEHLREGFAWPAQPKRHPEMNVRRDREPGAAACKGLGSVRLVGSSVESSNRAMLASFSSS